MLVILTKLQLALTSFLFKSDVLGWKFRYNYLDRSILNSAIAYCIDSSQMARNWRQLKSVPTARHQMWSHRPLLLRVWAEEGPTCSISNIWETCRLLYQSLARSVSAWISCLLVSRWSTSACLKRCTGITARLLSSHTSNSGITKPKVLILLGKII